jgi:hypothetical protein
MKLSNKGLYLIDMNMLLQMPGSFVDDFGSCWGKWGAYRLLLEPT